MTVQDARHRLHAPVSPVGPRCFKVAGTPWVAHLPDILFRRSRSYTAALQYDTTCQHENYTSGVHVIRLEKSASFRNGKQIKTGDVRVFVRRGCFASMFSQRVWWMQICAISTQILVKWNVFNRWCFTTFRFFFFYHLRLFVGLKFLNCFSPRPTGSKPWPHCFTGILLSVTSPISVLVARILLLLTWRHPILSLHYGVYVVALILSDLI